MATSHDHIDLDRAHALAGLLGRAATDLVPGGWLPPLWNLVYFLSRPAQATIGSDGHALTGVPAGSTHGVRRMFAGGRQLLCPGLRLEADATARTELVRSEDKQGRAGKMRFVTTRQSVYADDTLIMIDERDMVFIGSPSGQGQSRRHTEPASGPAADSSRPASRDESDAYRAVTVDPTLLFRFSALTYNAHRIHYDRDYARDVEGYPGLVVHGPLQALMMAEVASEVFQPDRGQLRVAYRLTAPLFEDQGMHVRAYMADDTAIAQVTDDTGRITAHAAVTSSAGPDYWAGDYRSRWPDEIVTRLL